MGKYMRKSKSTDDIASGIDFSQSPGVRARVKTLASQNPQPPEATTSLSMSPSPEQNSELAYLQLRDRRLEKTEIPLQQPICCSPRNPNPSLASSGSISEKDGVSVENQIESDEKTEVSCDLGANEAFGDNDTDFDGVERSTRESTPCSLIMDPKAISTPSSSTKRVSLEDPNRKTRSSVEMSTPSAEEIEEYFALHELDLRHFTEKYNFDFLNEKPLEGRYEWVRVQPW